MDISVFDQLKESSEFLLIAQKTIQVVGPRLCSNITKQMEDPLISWIKNQKIDDLDWNSLRKFAIESNSLNLMKTLFYLDFKKHGKFNSELDNKIRMHLLEMRSVNKRDEFKDLIQVVEFFKLDVFSFFALNSSNNLFELSQDQKLKLAECIRNMETSILDQLIKDAPQVFKSFQNIIILIGSHLCSNIIFELKDENGETHEIGAHKGFLSAQSDYFRSMLSGFFKEKTLEKIPLQDISFDTLSKILNYVITDTIEYPVDFVEVISKADCFFLIPLKNSIIKSVILTLINSYDLGEGQTLNLWDYALYENNSQLLNAIIYNEIQKQEMHPELCERILSYYSEKGLQTNLHKLKDMIIHKLKFDNQSLILCLRSGRPFPRLMSVGKLLTQLLSYFIVDECELNISISELKQLSGFQLLPLRVYLNDFSISDKQAANIADIIKYNNIKELYIDSNKITDNGAKAIAEVLKHNNTLMLLEIKDNKISYSGVEALIDALKENNTLKQIKLQAPQFFKNTIEDFEKKDITHRIYFN